MIMKDDDYVKRQMDFVMKVGFKMRTFLNDCLCDAFKDHEERAAALQSTLVNFIGNVLSEVSAEEHFTRNLNLLIDELNDWATHKDTINVKYDPNTNTVIKGDIH